MSLFYVVTVDVEGRGTVFHARCYGAQLPAVLAAASDALLAETDWMTQHHVRFTFEVKPA